MNQRKIKIIGVVFGCVVFVSAFLAVFGSSLHKLTIDNTSTYTKASSTTSVKKETTDTSTKTTTKSSSTITTDPSSYSLSDISSHDSATSCYSAINGSVYDLTDWVDSHPGGRMAILMICGKDGSPLFNMQHGGQSKPAEILATFKIGSLKT